jgi:hypothetical protein
MELVVRQKGDLELLDSSWFEVVAESRNTR